MSDKRFYQFGLWVIDNPNFNGISIADLVDTELMSITEVVELLNEQQDIIKKQCNHKKAILDFLNFMKMDNPLMEIMIDEFLEEVYDYDKGD